jgi:hypothetical protein
MVGMGISTGGTIGLGMFTIGFTSISPSSASQEKKLER